MKQKRIRRDYRIIVDIVKKNSKVLDLGCGTGELLYVLMKVKQANVQGIELNEESIYHCVEKGVTVYHGDIESGLKGYPDKSFDYVILHQSMQELKNVEYVLKEALRIGNYVIVGFSNFAYITARIRLFFFGKTPLTASLPYRWYNTPNVHFLSISDFYDFCIEKGIAIKEAFFLRGEKQVFFLPNLFALNSIFVLTIEGK